MKWLTQDSESEQKVLEQLGPDFGTFGLRPGLNGLQVTLVHPHLNLFRHTVGTATEKKNIDLQNYIQLSPLINLNQYTAYHMVMSCMCGQQDWTIKYIIPQFDPLDEQNVYEKAWHSYWKQCN